ncbi:MAG: peroxidase-related enzyme [Planctomycetes bacterium]|nr:peroxidase-related enzyme [Planctomycetota bacterium]
MPRLPAISPQSATGKARTLLEAVESKLGLVPNMTRAMASAPAALEGYLQLSGALAGGALPARTRELLALAVGQQNGCDYCLAAHTAIGTMVGLTAEQVRDARLATAVEPKTTALLRFAARLVEVRGRVSDADVAAVRAAGWDDGAIAEVVANVALNIFTNYFNHVAETEVDFPAAPALTQPAGARA